MPIRGPARKPRCQEGAQSPGNSVRGGEYPNEIAARYNFPFASDEYWTSVETGRIGLIEPGLGTALPATATGTFDELLKAYRASAGIGDPPAHVVSVAAADRSSPPATRSMTSAPSMSALSAPSIPRSQLVLYAGSGHDNGAGSDVFTAYQSAIWDTVNNPDVVSSSFTSYQHVSPGSPFYFAQKELFIDAALRGITIVNAAGDGGSGEEYPNGLTNIEINARERLQPGRRRRLARARSPPPARTRR